MEAYIRSILNRITRFSQQLDNRSLLIDQPWVLINTDEDYRKYIFRRNGELVMSINGQAHIGSWDYLSGAKSLLLKSQNENKLLNHAFFDQAIMILRIDGTNDELFVLANENIITDLNVEEYLKSILRNKYNIVTGTLKDGRTIEIYREKQDTPEVGMVVTIDGIIPTDGEYQLSTKSKRIFSINAGKISRIIYPTIYEIENNIMLKVQQANRHKISIGDRIFINVDSQGLSDFTPAPSGKYKLGSFHKIVVSDGVVSKM